MKMYEKSSLTYLILSCLKNLQPSTKVPMKKFNVFLWKYPSHRTPLYGSYIALLLCFCYLSQHNVGIFWILVVFVLFLPPHTKPCCRQADRRQISRITQSLSLPFPFKGILSLLFRSLSLLISLKQPTIWIYFVLQPLRIIAGHCICVSADEYILLRCVCVNVLAVLVFWLYLPNTTQNCLIYIENFDAVAVRWLVGWLSDCCCCCCSIIVCCRCRCRCCCYYNYNANTQLLLVIPTFIY